MLKWPCSCLLNFPKSFFSLYIGLNFISFSPMPKYLSFVNRKKKSEVNLYNNSSYWLGLMQMFTNLNQSQRDLTRQFIFFHCNLHHETVMITICQNLSSSLGYPLPRWLCCALRVLIKGPLKWLLHCFPGDLGRYLWYFQVIAQMGYGAGTVMGCS